MYMLLPAILALNTGPRAGPIKAVARRPTTDFCYGLPVRLPVRLGWRGLLIATCVSALGSLAVRTSLHATASASLKTFDGHHIPPFGNFDPFNMLKGKSQDVVYRWREAEITHGRVGMLAAAGFLVQEKCASNPICMHHSAQMSSSMRGIPIAYRFHPLFSGVGGPAIKQIPQLPPAIWFCMTMGIAFTEALRIQKGWANPYESSDNLQRLKPGYYPGGYVTCSVILHTSRRG